MRTLTIHLPIALLTGLLVFGLLLFSAWYNYRAEPDVYGIQDPTQSVLKGVERRIQEFKDEHGRLPETLYAIPHIVGAGIGAGGEACDTWGNELQYSVSGNHYTLFSLGRDGKPGGVGWDVDRFADGRNQRLAMPTLRQFFGSDLDTAHFFQAALMAGILVVLTVLLSLEASTHRGQEPSLFQMARSVLVVILFASVIGTLLLPLHIPSGH